MTITTTTIEERLASLAAAQGLTADELAERILADGADRIEADLARQQARAEAEEAAANARRLRGCAQRIFDLSRTAKHWPLIDADRLETIADEDLAELGFVRPGPDGLAVVVPSRAVLWQLEDMGGRATADDLYQSLPFSSRTIRAALLALAAEGRVEVPRLGKLNPGKGCRSVLADINVILTPDEPGLEVALAAWRQAATRGIVPIAAARPALEAAGCRTDATVLAERLIARGVVRAHIGGKCSAADSLCRIRTEDGMAYSLNMEPPRWWDPAEDVIRAFKDGAPYSPGELATALREVEAGLAPETIEEIEGAAEVRPEYDGPKSSEEADRRVACAEARMASEEAGTSDMVTFDLNSLP